MKKIKKVVIPAAGLGTRFLPATKVIPKEMLPVVDKPMIQYNVEEAKNAGIEELIVITSKGKELILDHFDISYELEELLYKTGKTDSLEMIQKLSRMVTLITVRQKEAKGLGHAIYCAKHAIGNEPFAVILGDDLVDGNPPCIEQMVKLYEKYGECIIGLYSVPSDKVHLYGIVDGKKVDDNLYELNKLIEKPSKENAPTNLAIIGRYILIPEIFDILREIKPGKGGEIQITDALQELAKQRPVYGYLIQGKRYDAGDKFGYIESNVIYGLKHKDISEKVKEFIKKLAAELD